MSTKTTGPQVPVDEPSTAETPAAPETDPVLVGDEFPFESAEFGVGGFLPPLEAPTDG